MYNARFRFNIFTNTFLYHFYTLFVSWNYSFLLDYYQIKLVKFEHQDRLITVYYSSPASLGRNNTNF